MMSPSTPRLRKPLPPGDVTTSLLTLQCFFKDKRRARSSHHGPCASLCCATMRKAQVCRNCVTDPDVLKCYCGPFRSVLA
ncbi:hypothetical protein Q9966_016550 [Columba livia]|nr:hypothetical protein Q9966_016550 [Columba livia]